jgi:hypothetical protein
MTAREFLKEYGISFTAVNMFLLNKYTGYKVNYQRFPDKEITIKDPEDFIRFAQEIWDDIERTFRTA